MRNQIELDFTVSRKMKTLVPAAEVWDMLETTGRIGDEFGPGRTVQLCGTISFKVNGEELLGPKYWIELFNMMHLAPLADGTIDVADERATNRDYETVKVRFERRADGTAFYSLMQKNKRLAARSVNMQNLADAWTYLWFRVQRLSAELGDTWSMSRLKYHSYFPSDYFDGVDSSLIDFAVEAPLQEVLSTPKSFG